MPPEKKTRSPLSLWMKLAKWGIGLLLGGAILSLLALNLFLATPIGRGLVAKKLSGAVRLPLTVGAASYTPWGGVRLKNVRVEQIEAAQAIVSDPFFSADSFEADVDLFSLLGDEIVVNRLVCASPKISMVHISRILARAPVVVEGGDVPVQPQAGAGANEGATAEPSPPEPATPTAQRPPSQPAKKKNRTVVFGVVEINKGEVVMTSTDGTELLRIDDLRMSFDYSGDTDAGRLEIGRATLLEHLDLRELVSPLKIDAQQVTLTSLSARCGSGEISGELTFGQRLNGTPFVARLSAQGIEVAELLEAAAPGLASGKIGGEVTLRGIAQSMGSIQGVGELHVESAVLKPRPEFESLGSALEVDAQGRVMLDPVEAEFAIQGGVIGLREASVGSGRILVKSVGGVRMDGTLNVATRIYLAEDLYSGVRSKPVPGRAPLKFERLEGTDWFYRDELVTGTLGDPRLDFWRTGMPVAPAAVMEELRFEFESPQGESIAR